MNEVHKWALGLLLTNSLQNGKAFIRMQRQTAVFDGRPVEKMELVEQR